MPSSATGDGRIVVVGDELAHEGRHRVWVDGSPILGCEHQLGLMPTRFGLHALLKLMASVLMQDGNGSGV
jgi:hypothetical protein